MFGTTLNRRCRALASCSVPVQGSALGSRSWGCVGNRWGGCAGKAVAASLSSRPIRDWWPRCWSWSSTTRRGDPESPLFWTTVSTRNQAATLTGQGASGQPRDGGQATAHAGVLAAANARPTIDGVQHPERDTTFDCPTEQAKAHLVTTSRSSPWTPPEVTRRGAHEPGTAARVSPAGDPEQVKRTTSSTSLWARPTPTVWTIQPRTPDGSRSTPTARPPRSP